MCMKRGVPARPAHGICNERAGDPLLDILHVTCRCGHSMRRSIVLYGYFCSACGNIISDMVLVRSLGGY